MLAKDAFGMNNIRPLFGFWVNFLLNRLDNCPIIITNCDTVAEKIGQKQTQRRVSYNVGSTGMFSKNTE